MQIISVVIELQAFSREIIQREADICKLKKICMIQSNSFVRCIVAQNEYELKLNAALLLKNMANDRKGKDCTQIIAQIIIFQKNGVDILVFPTIVIARVALLLSKLLEEVP